MFGHTRIEVSLRVEHVGANTNEIGDGYQWLQIVVSPAPQMLYSSTYN